MGLVHCAHEYLNFKGGKFGKSQRAAVDVPYFLSKYDPNPLRYYLTATAPETRDYAILRVVENLKTILTPILPHTAQRLHEHLGYDGQLIGTQHVVEYQKETQSHLALTYDHSGAVGAWAPIALPAPLFKKFDERVVEGEYARLEA